MDIIQTPFHDVVIQALPDADENKLREIAWWLMRTRLPHGTHEKVRKAWGDRCFMIKFSDHALSVELLTHLSEQERLIAERWERKIALNAAAMSPC